MEKRDRRKGRKKNGEKKKIPQERLLLTGAIQHANSGQKECIYGSRDRERGRRIENSRGLVNRTIVKHLPFAFFFSPSLDSVRSTQQKPLLLPLLSPTQISASYPYLRLFSLYKETALECINKWISCHRRTALGGGRAGGRAAGVTNYFKLDDGLSGRSRSETMPDRKPSCISLSRHFACLFLMYYRCTPYTF